MKIIELVCSGGQTGADVNGLKAAKLYGIKTSGFMPKGWKTLDGPKPQYRESYGMFEHKSPNYKDRTWDNVRATDGTIRVAKNFDSSGEKCTLNGIKKYNKPHLDIIFPGSEVFVKLHFNHFISWEQYFKKKKEEIELIIEFLKNKNIKRLNIAGNSEQTALGIGIFVFTLFSQVFYDLGYKTQYDEV